MKMQIRIANLVAFVVVVMVATGCRERPFLRNHRVIPEQSIVLEQMVGPQVSGYMQSGPTMAGTRLASFETPTATEHAIRLSENVDKLRAENRRLQQEIEQLEHALEMKEQEFLDIERGLEFTEDALSGTKQSLRERDILVDQLRRRLVSAKQRQVAELDALSEYVQQLIEQHSSPNRRASPVPQLEEIPAPNNFSIPQN